MKLRLKLLILLVAVSSVGGWVLRQYPAAAPIREGTSAAFWNHACDVELGDTRRSEWGAFIYEPRDGWFVYYDQGLEEQTVYRVSESLAMADFPAVVKALDTHPESSTRPYVGEAFRVWSNTDPTKHDARRLLKEIRSARGAWLENANPGGKADRDAFDQEFEVRWKRAQRYWLSALFEFAYIAGLIVIAAVPWLRSSGRLVWSIHLGLMPLLLLLPWYLGYVPLVFTSAFPNGGIVYPWLVIHFRGFPWTAVDSFVLQHTPKVLEPLSQLNGPRIALTGLGAFGPVAALGTGAALGAVSFAIGTAVHKLRNRTVGSPVNRTAEEAVQLAMRRVTRLYWWMGFLGLIGYVIGATAYYFSSHDGTEVAAVFVVMLILLHSACLAAFASSLFVANRLARNPTGILPCARLVAIVLSTAYFPILTVPGAICMRSLNRHFAAYCELMRSNAEK